MKVDAVIFDKDGTLIDFDAFWLIVSVKAIAELLSIVCLPDVSVSDILEPYGIHNGVTSIEGVVCKGTYAQMGTIAYDVLKKHGCELTREEIIRLVEEMYVKNANAGEILPTCQNPAETLQTLKNQGKKLAVVTTDNYEMTLKCLNTLEITAYFDAIYTDDGKLPTKPDAACAEDFCRRFALKKENVLMVGDTLTDVEFSKNAGLSMIGVAKTEENKNILLNHIGTVVPDISYLPELI